ncbi:MAG TPA: TRAP transporter large permease [Pseudolabrys sp.]|nr:TRAP transporter large permease [Pseudolabrys sp.]
MYDPFTIALIGFAAMFLLIVLHVPIGIAMGTVGAVGFASIVGLDPALSLLASEPASVFTNLDLAVIPLFLLMGSLAGAAGLPSDVYNLAYAFIGHRRGGLALATIGGCGGFGAVCGSAIATTATFGRVALPEMLRRGYSPALAAGSIAAGGTLGIIVPPSSIMVIYAILTEQFIVHMFIAAIVPAIMAIAFYLIAAAIYVRLNPKAGPAGERMPWPERWKVIKANWGVLFLATVVLGGIYTGVFTVNEAAAVGVTIALAFAILRGRLGLREFLDVLVESAATTLMIYVMLIGASIFSYFMSVAHAPDRLIEAITDLHLSGGMVILLLLIMYLILGAIFDEVAAIVITLPFVLPIIKHFGYDLVWWGIINVIVVEIAMISPPIGLNVFVIHGMRKDIKLGTIYRGIMPFLAADIVRLALLALFPSLTLFTLQWLK